MVAATFLLLVSVSIVVPYVIKERNAITTEMSAARTYIDGLNWDNMPDSALIGPKESDMIFGIRYIVSGFPGRVPLTDALPPNTGETVAYFELEMGINAAGEVVTLNPLNITTEALGDQVIEALLNWTFDAVGEGTPVQEGKVIVVYDPE